MMMMTLARVIEVQLWCRRLTAGANLRRAVVGSLNCQVAVRLLLA
jgi:hypothetical protein